MPKVRGKGKKKNRDCRSIWIKVKSYDEGSISGSTQEALNSLESIFIEKETEKTQGFAQEFTHKDLEAKGRLEEKVGTHEETPKERAEERAKESAKGRLEETLDFKTGLLALKALTEEINRGIDEIRESCSQVLKQI